MGDTVHGKYIGMKNSLMGMDNVKIHFRYLTICKPGKTYGGQKLGK